MRLCDRRILRIVHRHQPPFQRTESHSRLMQFHEKLPSHHTTPHFRQTPPRFIQMKLLFDRIKPLFCQTEPPCHFAQPRHQCRPACTFRYTAFSFRHSSPFVVSVETRCCWDSVNKQINNYTQNEDSLTPRSKNLRLLISFFNPVSPTAAFPKV